MRLPICVPFLMIAAALSGCSQVPDQANTNRVASLEADVAERDLKIAELESKLAAQALARPTATVRQSAAAKPKASAPARRAMCYKDYCPCDPPQGGPDSILCDQLEEGVTPDIQLMIAGRGMREARRQIETGDY